MARPALPEPADRDRLFVRRIIDERARALFGDNLQYLIDLPSEDRWQMAHAEPDDEEDDKPEMSPDFRQIFTECLADLEAWIVVERVRSASRAAVRKRRGRKHAD